MDINKILGDLRAAGNLRTIPPETAGRLIDLTSNDYLGIADDEDLRIDLLGYALENNIPLSASASRLLSSHQIEHTKLENLMSDLYPGRKSLIFNSGYHANTGIVSALADRDTLIVADRLVHASIIDGILLSRAKLERYRHNDMEHLRQIMEQKARDYANVLIITESVFSMDGDSPDIDALVDIKRLHPGAMLYVDEAHAFGVTGPRGLGLVAASGHIAAVDVIVGTLGKALASVGAFAIVSPEVREFLVNKSRSFIFSTALPPVNVAWSRLLIERMLGMEATRAHVAQLGRRLAEILGSSISSHIQPYIVGDAAKAVAISQAMFADGVKVLPIRTPTVPQGTERLRFSISASLTDHDMDRVERAFKKAVEPKA